MATTEKRTWERPTARPLTAEEGRADVLDVPALNAISISGQTD